jgi:hypothetical protein
MTFKFFKNFSISYSSPNRDPPVSTGTFCRLTFFTICISSGSIYFYRFRYIFQLFFGFCFQGRKLLFPFYGVALFLYLYPELLPCFMPLLLPDRGICLSFLSIYFLRASFFLYEHHYPLLVSLIHPDAILSNSLERYQSHQSHVFVLSGRILQSPLFPLESMGEQNVLFLIYTGTGLLSDNLSMNGKSILKKSSLCWESRIYRF